MPSPVPQPTRIDVSRPSGTKSLPGRHMSPITPAVTGIIFPSPVETSSTGTPSNGRARSLRRVSHRESFSPEPKNLVEITDSPFAPPQLDDSAALDDLWNTLRLEKEAKMNKEKAKVKSLEEFKALASANGDAIRKSPSPRPGSSSKRSPPKPSPLRESSPPPTVQSARTERRTLLDDIVSNQDQDSFFAASYPPQRVNTPLQTIKKKKSILTFRPSPDKNYVVAIFDLRGTGKDDIRVTYRQDRIVVSWEKWEVEEWEEEQCICRKTVERVYHRVITLAEGVKFRDCYATMKGEDLLLRYPRHGMNGTRSQET